VEREREIRRGCSPVKNTTTKTRVYVKDNRKLSAGSL
jgi:hypothetical protein